MNRTQLTLVKTAAAAATAFLSLPSHAASPSEGVACPSGTQAQRNGNVLVCRKEERKVLESICSPVAFSTKGVALNGNITMDPTGSDQCLAAVTGAKVPSVMRPPVVGIDPPASAFSRVVNPTGPDTFVATKVSFEWPERFPLERQVGHDASRGVACPSGFETDNIAGGRGIQCEKREERSADCDVVWKISRDVDGNKDACFLDSPIGRTKGNYTIPKGITGLTGNPETHGWNLQVKNGADLWVKEKKEFSFPNSR